MIKKFALAVATVALLASNASAAQIVGSQAFVGGVTDTAGINSLSQVDITAFQIISISSRTGDFLGSPNIEIAGPFTLNFALGSPLSFSTTAFGTFNGTITSDDTSSVNSRAVYFDGTFTAGTFSAKNDLTTATIILTFNQTGGAGNAISVSGTLVTPGIVRGVPEPSTVAALASGVVMMGGFAIRRRRAAKA